MRGRPLFAALRLILSDIEKAGSTWAGIARLRHKSRHKFSIDGIAEIPLIVQGVPSPPPPRARGRARSKKFKKNAVHCWHLVVFCVSADTMRRTNEPIANGNRIPSLHSHARYATLQSAGIDPVWAHLANAHRFVHTVAVDDGHSFEASIEQTVVDQLVLFKF
jgi:hypothetical protein